MAAEIPLTRGFVALVDDADARVVMRFKWQICFNERYAKTSIGRKSVLMHRFLLVPQSGLGIDHIDGDGLNNQRHNLRLATPSQNGANTRRAVNNKHGFPGVVLIAGLYRGRVSRDRHQYFTKGFRTAAEAFDARENLRQSLHGAFASPFTPPDLLACPVVAAVR